MSLIYLLVNPFPPTPINGVNSYCKSAFSVLSNHLDVRLFANSRNECLPEFRKTLAMHLAENYKPDGVIVEAPETRAASLSLSDWNVHVRLHCPMGVAQKYADQVVDEGRFSDELRAMREARVVSSPSYGMITELRDRIDLRSVIVNKNPISIEPAKNDDRDIDVLYMGRFDALKTSTLKAILTRLPRGLRIGLVGQGANSFAKSLALNITLCFEHIDSEDRYPILARARTVIVPSRFENCSMMILEAIAHCVPVVAWDVGGNSEFPGDIVRTVKYRDVSAFVDAVSSSVARIEAPERFRTVTDLINDDYLSGIKAVIESEKYKSPFKRITPARSIISRIRSLAFKDRTL